MLNAIEKAEGRTNWAAICRSVYRHVLEVGANELATSDIDWLAYAVEKLGGIKEAATKLGISQSKLYRWLDGGLSKASFGEVVGLGDLTGIALDRFAERGTLKSWKA
jgi:DNA-binding phage protein